MTAVILIHWFTQQTVNGLSGYNEAGFAPDFKAICLAVSLFVLFFILIAVKVPYAADLADWSC